MAEHRGGSGNFAENREKASEAGRKGGQHSGGISKTIRNELLKPVKKVVRIVTADVNPIIPDLL
ncbi:hypothetical protein RB531_5017 [Salmonella enterica subsp. enterica serovar Typhimurium]